MNAGMKGWLKPLLWVAAIVLFVLGAYSDTATTEMWGWGFALLTAGFLVEHLPGKVGR